MEMIRTLKLRYMSGFCWEGFGEGEDYSRVLIGVVVLVIILLLIYYGFQLLSP